MPRWTFVARSLFTLALIGLVGSGPLLVLVHAQGHEHRVIMPAIPHHTCPMQSGLLQGSLRNVDGVSPIAEAHIVLLDANGNVVGEAVTAADGTFSFGQVADGTYEVTCGLLRLSVEMGAASEGAATELVIVVPEAAILAFDYVGGLSVTEWILVGTAAVGVAAGIAVPIVVDNAGQIRERRRTQFISPFLPGSDAGASDPDTPSGDPDLPRIRDFGR